jgi:asparagine synthetase B (glutamine-hydrolysing)
MSLFAGIVARRADVRIAEEDRRALEGLIARDAALPRRILRSDVHHLVHVDLGSNGSAGVIACGTATSLIAGDAVLDGPYARATRAGELEVLHEAWRDGDLAPLQHSRGTFALVHVGTLGRVSLVTDRIGLRPLYLWMDEDRVVFASSLRVMEQLPCVPKRVDLRAAGEMLVFGYPLADRTPYAGIRRLEGGLEFDVDGSRVREARYWRPEDVRTSPDAAADLERAAYEAFREGVRLRRRGDRSCLALLSGGLDSRCVAAVLQDEGADVQTLAFSYGNETQDHLFSERFAGAAGMRYRRFAPKPGAKTNWGLLARQCFDSVREELLRPDRPTFLWTGDNGSFTVGFVHMSDELFAHLRAGRDSEAVDAYLGACARVPARFLRKGVAARLESEARRGLEEQLASIQCDDPAKRIYVFYLMTEARHILSEYFEEVDRHRLDTPVPFCDGRLLEVMLSVPPDAGLRHEFYHRMLGHFPPATVSVPWQTYPGHAPCPVPHGTVAHAQWRGLPADYDRSIREYERSLCSRLFRAPLFPSPFVRKGRLRLAAWADALGVRRLGHVFRAAATLQRIYAVAGGNLDRDPAAAADERRAARGRVP